MPLLTLSNTTENRAKVVDDDAAEGGLTLRIAPPRQPEGEDDGSASAPKLTTQASNTLDDDGADGEEGEGDEATAAGANPQERGQPAAKRQAAGAG